MAEYKVDVRTNSLESGLVYAPFDKAITELRSQGHEPIEAGLNAVLRILEGPQSSISQNGNYVKEGNIYLKEEQGIIVRGSPLLSDSQMLNQAIEANRQGRYFSTPNRELYEKFLKQVREDASKAPRERRAILMPSYKPFKISQKDNREVFDFLQLSQAYLDFVNQDSLTFYPISQDTLKGYSGTVPTQLWFGSLDDGRSDLVGNLDLVDDDRVRGVRQVVSTAGANVAQKISQPESELYTPEQIAEALEGLQFKSLEALLFKALRKD